MQSGLNPLSPMSRIQILNQPPMGTNQTREDARGTSGPLWLTYDPIRYIGKHTHSDRSGLEAEARGKPSKSQFFNRLRKGPRRVRAGAPVTPDPSRCPFDHIHSIEPYRRKA